MFYMTHKLLAIFFINRDPSYSKMKIKQRSPCDILKLLDVSFRMPNVYQYKLCVFISYLQYMHTQHLLLFFIFFFQFNFNSVKLYKC